MKLVHVSDLHLGKTAHERDLLPDQAVALGSLVALCGRERPAVLIVAGDVYDRSMPSSEAVELFGGFLAELRMLSDPPAVVIISGNHDSPRRLGFGERLLDVAGVHMRTRVEDIPVPVVVERDGERVRLWTVPFLASGSIDLDGPFTQEAAFEKALALVADARASPSVTADNARANGGNPKGSHDVLVAHLFATGCAGSGSERSFVGGAEMVDSGAFEDFDYVALGHLHAYQRAGSKGRYPGAIMQYSFAESGRETGALVVELADGSFTERLVGLDAPRKFVRVSGLCADLLTGRGACDDYVEAELLDEAPVLNAAEKLRAVYPNLLSVRQRAFEAVAASAQAEDRASRSDDPLRAVRDDFLRFHQQMKGREPSPELLSLFGEMVSAEGDAP